MNAKAIPEGFHSLIPSLIVNNSAKAIEFYQQAFGAKKRRMFNMPDGKTIYAEIQIGDSILILTDEYQKWKPFHLYRLVEAQVPDWSCMLRM
jgi:PhnB protein